MHKHVFIGGTFDHFHAGHARFIMDAAALGETLHIGVTEPALTADKFLPELIEPLAARIQSVQQFCGTHHITAELEVLKDHSGSAHTAEASHSILCVTTATEQGGIALNERRKAAGREALPITVVPLIPAADGAPIASARIRAGQITRDGVVFASVLEETIQLSAAQRRLLQTITGEVVSTVDNSTQNFVIGDVTLKEFREQNWPYQLAVFDGFSERKELSQLPVTAEQIALTASNSAGQISKHLSQTLVAAVRQHAQHVFVQGEEDLAAVVLALQLPLESQLFFGVPGLGMRRCTVTEQLKLQLYGLLAA